MPLKFLTIESEINSVKTGAQIISIPKNAKKILRDFIVENFPKVFVILLEINEEIDEILKLINEKFANRPLLVQVKSDNLFNFYMNRGIEFKKVENTKFDENSNVFAEMLLSNAKKSLIETETSQLTASGCIRKIQKPHR